MSDWGPLEWAIISAGAVAAVVVVALAVTDWWVLRKDCQQHKGWQ
jgi:hypothetical protein